MGHRSLTLLLASLLAAPGPAAAALRVVTTTEGLAALAREVGGDRVAVTSLSRGVQDPHFVDANPMLAVKLRDADLLVDVGLELEVGWLPPLVTQSRNADIQPGGRRRLTAASAVEVLDVPTGTVDRSRGDLHPGLDGELDPAGASRYQARAAALAGRLDAALAAWKAQLQPLAGRKLFVHHRTLTYFLDWTGLVSAGEMEPRPGTPPPSSHLADLVTLARKEGIKACVVENYYDTRSDELVARLIGGTVVRIPGDVGGEPAASSYQAWLDLLVQRVAAAVK
jgi:zinc/manganese transport system substrate-binding protein